MQMAKYDELIASIKNYEAFIGEITYNEPLAQKTTFKVGGTAELFIKPQNYYSFQIVLSNLLATNTPFFILGGGSNVVFPDGNFHKVVVSTQSFTSVDKLAVRDLPMDFTEKSIPKDKILITCFSGTPMASLVNYCTEHYISGVEQFAGLPGSVGGATFMNARCFDKSISDIIYYTTHMNLNKDKVELEHNRFDPSQWDYKKSPFQDGNKFITTVTFFLFFIVFILIMGETNPPDEISAQKGEDDNPERKEHLTVKDVPAISQIGHAEELQGKSQLQETQTDLDAVHPVTALGSTLQPGGEHGKQGKRQSQGNSKAKHAYRWGNDAATCAHLHEQEPNDGACTTKAYQTKRESHQKDAEQAGCLVGLAIHGISPRRRQGEFKASQKRGGKHQ